MTTTFLKPSSLQKQLMESKRQTKRLEDHSNSIPVWAGWGGGKGVSLSCYLRFPRRQCGVTTGISYARGTRDGGGTRDKEGTRDEGEVGMDGGLGMEGKKVHELLPKPANPTPAPEKKCSEMFSEVQLTIVSFS